MTYDDFANSDSRTPITLVKFGIDCCTLVYGSAPCTAAGAASVKCYNSWSSCQDKANFTKGTKEVVICSLGQIPFAGPRPYLKDLRYNPTEIKDGSTGRGRVTITAVDEPDDDIGIDPYVDERTSVQGTFWKKLIARNPNTKGRPVEILDGFIGLAEVDFKERWVGEINKIELKNGSVSITCLDLLQSLSDTEIPAKLNIKTVNAITIGQAEIILTTTAGLIAPGEIRIEDELIEYTGIDSGQNKLTGGTRGAGGTVASAHDADSKVEPARYIAPTNPFDLLLSFLTDDAGIDAARIDTAAFTYWRDWPETDIDFSTWLVKPTKLSTLFWEIVDLLDLNVWQNEDQLITICRNLPNEPGRTYSDAISDGASIIHNSASAVLDDDFIKTRIVLYWELTILGALEKEADYLSIDTAVNLDLEDVNSLDQSIEDKIFCRWIRRDYLSQEAVENFVDNLLQRRLFNREEGRATLVFGVELKDGAIKTGDLLRISTDELMTTDGLPLDRESFRIWRRDAANRRINLKAWRLPQRNICFIAPDTAPDFDQASEADKEYGYICADDGLMPDGSRGYSIY